MQPWTSLFDVPCILKKFSNEPINIHPPFFSFLPCRIPSANCCPRTCPASPRWRARSSRAAPCSTGMSQIPQSHWLTSLSSWINRDKVAMMFRKFSPVLSRTGQMADWSLAFAGTYWNSLVLQGGVVKFSPLVLPGNAACRCTANQPIAEGPSSIPRN